MSEKFTLGGRLDIGTAPVALVSLSVHEAISEVVTATAEIASRAELDVPGSVGGSATASLLLDGAEARRFTLVIGQLAFRGVEDGSLRYRIDMFSPFWRLRHTRQTRKFRNMSAKDIVTSVLTEGGIDHRWSILREPPVRKYCLQYRESNFDFVCRLLEFEGIFYTVEQDGSLTLEDRSPAVDFVAGNTDFSLLEHAGSLEGGELGVHAFGRGARVRTGKVTVNDFNWKTPSVSLLKSASADRDTELELYDYPTGYRKPDQGTELSQFRLEAVRANARFAKGTSNVLHFFAGRRFRFDGEELLLTRVDHVIHDVAFTPITDAVPRDAEPPTYANHWEAIPADVVFRPALVTTVPRVDGCHTAMVRGPIGEEIHTDQFGRMRAQFHWDREATSTDEDSRWLRKLQESQTSVNLARVGWEVSVVYVDGDPDRPVALARHINGVMMPEYGQPANKQTMTIKSPTYPGKVGFNEIKLDDSAGAMRIDMHAQMDFVSRVENNKTETIAQNQTHNIDRQLMHKVDRDQTLNVGSDQQIEVGTDLMAKVDKDRTETVGGNQSIEVAGVLTTTVGGSQTESVGSVRLSIVGTASPPDVAANAKGMVPDAKSAATSVAQGAKSGGAAGAGASLKSMVPSPEGAANQLTGGLSSGDVSSLLVGEITRSATERISRTVGGAHLAIANDNIDVTAQYVHVEAVGGVKLSVTGDTHSQSAGKAMALTVGGALFKKAGTDAGYGSRVSTITVGALGSFAAGERMEITGKEITLNASAKMKLVSGGLSFELTPAKAKLTGAIRLDASEKVIVTGSDDNLTG